jgi:hypothetical protein
VAVTRQLRLVLGSAAALAVTAVSLRLLLPPESRGDFLASIRGADWRLLLVALLLNPAVQYFRAWRFGLFLERREAPPGLPLFRISVLLLFFNYLLPLRMGEATFPILVKREYGTGMTTSIGFLALTRVLDLLAVVLAGGLAGLLLLGPGSTWGAIAGLAVLGAAGALAAVLILARMSARTTHRLLTRWPRVERFTGKLLEGLHLLGELRRYAVFLSLTAAVWLTQYVVCFLVLSAVAPGSGFGRAVVGGSAGMLSFALPVNGVAGIGPMQAAWAWALTQVGVEWAIGVASGLLLHGVFLLGAVAVAGVVVFVGPGSRAMPTSGGTTA